MCSIPPVRADGIDRDDVDLRGNARRIAHLLDDNVRARLFVATCMYPGVSRAMAKRFPIQLAITSGHPAMIGTGPLGGHTVETGIVIASTDALAADVVGARLLGFTLQAVRHLWEARSTRCRRKRHPSDALSSAVIA